MLFKRTAKKLSEVSQIDFEKEKEVQTLIEENLEAVFGLKFLATEFSILNMRFDTVAFDSENNAFIIIEYKKAKNMSLVDQGYSYLHTVLDRKAELVLLFSRVNGERRQIEDFCWDMTRVYFVSPSFSKFQIGATAYANMPFRLFEISKYEDGLFEIKEIENKSSINLPSQDEDSVMRKVSREVKVWTFEDYLGRTRPNEDILEIYSLLDESVANITQFEHDYKKVYIAFKHNRENIFDCAFSKTKIKIWINLKWGELGDLPSDLHVENVSSKGHHGNGDYQFEVSSAAEVEMIVPVIRKAYEKKISGTEKRYSQSNK